jgi:hypothetical protein
MAPADAASDLGWDNHRRAQLYAWCDATPAQRLAWLEAAIVFAHQTGALPRPVGKDGAAHHR